MRRKPYLRKVSIFTSCYLDMIDVTDEVRETVLASGFRHGTALVYTPHTTLALMVNEHEDGFLADLKDTINRLIPRDAFYRHDDFATRNQNLTYDEHGNLDERVNGFAHLQHVLFGRTNLNFIVANGELFLGRWQKIFVIEMDDEREREFFVQVQGT